MGEGEGGKKRILDEHNWGVLGESGPLWGRVEEKMELQAWPTASSLSAVIQPGCPAILHHRNLSISSRWTYYLFYAEQSCGKTFHEEKVYPHVLQTVVLRSSKWWIFMTGKTNMPQEYVSSSTVSVKEMVEKLQGDHSENSSSSSYVFSQISHQPKMKDRLCGRERGKLYLLNYLINTLNM